jgi:hypothetical protein
MMKSFAEVLLLSTVAVSSAAENRSAVIACAGVQTLLAALRSGNGNLSIQQAGVATLRNLSLSGALLAVVNVCETPHETSDL